MRVKHDHGRTLIHQFGELLESRDERFYRFRFQHDAGVNSVGPRIHD